MNYEPKKGQRWEDEDSRHADRVVRVLRTVGRYARVRVEVSSLNPKTVGRKQWMLKRTLRERYRLVSH